MLIYLARRHNFDVNDIPDDVMERVFDFLPTIDRIRCQAVCRSWAEPTWRSISLTAGLHGFEKAQSEWFYANFERALPSLRSLQLHWRSLQHIKVRRTLMYITKFTRLTCLDLGYKNSVLEIKEPHLNILSSLALESMECTFSACDGPHENPGRVSIQDFARFPLLKHLAVNFSLKTTDELGEVDGVLPPDFQLNAVCKGFRHLKSLRMNNLHKIFLTSAFVGLVKRLEELELTQLVIPLTSGPRGPLEAPHLRKFAYKLASWSEPRGKMFFPFTATSSLQELTWAGHPASEIQKFAAKFSKLKAVKLHLFPEHGRTLRADRITSQELCVLDIPALRELRVDAFANGLPFALHAFVHFKGLERLKLRCFDLFHSQILISYGFLEHLQVLKLTTPRLQLGSGFQYLKALKVLHLNAKRITGQLESNTLETLKLKCYHIEVPIAEKVGPFGYLPQLKRVEIGAHLCSPTGALALAYGLGRLHSLRNIVLLRGYDPPIMCEREEGWDADIDFLDIVLQGLSNRQSQMDQIILEDPYATCTLGGLMLPRVRHLEIVCKAALLDKSCHGGCDWLDDVSFLRLRLSELGHPGIAPLVESLERSESHATRRVLKVAPWDCSNSGQHGTFFEYVEARREDSKLTPEYYTQSWTVNSDIV